MGTHSKWGASGAHRYLRCGKSIELEADLPDQSSEFAREGTAAHELAAWALSNGRPADAYEHRVIDVEGQTFAVDREMCSNVQEYVDAIADFAQGNEVFVEQKVSYSDYLGVEDAYGTADAIIPVGTELQVHDLKYGRGYRVNAENNEQLMLYALGALSEFEMLGDFTTIRMVIHQPRLNHVSEWSITVDELKDFARRANATVQKILTKPEFNPSEVACRWCKAKATCPALNRHIQDEFEAVEEPGPTVQSVDLAHAMTQVDLIEAWCKAVRAEVERRLLMGHQVNGYKLVEGRKGARKWANPEDAEQALKTMRLKHDDMYAYSLISPTTAEKLVKSGKLGPRQWTSLQTLIEQSEGKPSVAPASDKRDALVIANDFEAVA